MDPCRELKQNPEIIIPPGYEHLVEPAQYELVEKTRVDWQGSVRDFLRSETGLKLSAAGKQHSVSITVRNYVSPIFDVLINQLNMENSLLSKKRPLLKSLQSGSRWLNDYFARNPNAKMQLALTDQDIESAPAFELAVTKILDKLPRWQVEFAHQFRNVKEDVMGAYSPRGKFAELHWIPIAMIAETLEVPIEDLSLVVLAHELAHTYTHVGMDIGGGSWDTDSFIAADRAVLEGLAQYYTLVYLTKHASSVRDDGPLTAFHRLLEMQHSDYHTHRFWMAGDPTVQSESVRLALLDARLTSSCSEPAFTANVAENKLRLARPG
jgi:hypothetical protein